MPSSSPVRNTPGVCWQKVIASKLSRWSEEVRSLSTDVDLARVLRLGTHELKSRLIAGTGRYDSLEVMAASLDAAGVDCVTVAVRRERMYDASGQNLLDYLDLNRYTLLPNTAGCYSVEDALRTARLEI